MLKQTIRDSTACMEDAATRPEEVETTGLHHVRCLPPPNQARLLSLADAMGDLCQDAESAHRAYTTGMPRGPVTGIPELDTALSGALSVGLHFVLGNAGAGKTALSMQIAARCRCPAMVVTCEMAPVELLRRQIARETNTFLHGLKTGEMPRLKIEQLACKAIEAAPGISIVDATLAPASLTFLLQAAEVVKGDGAHLLIVVDSLQSWAEGATDGISEYEILNRAVAELRSLAFSLNCPILVVSERNRDGMKGGGLNSGAGTRKIEYGAETVIDLHRDNDVRPDGSGEVPVKLTTSKNRNGEKDKTVTLKFHGALQRFRDA